MHRPPQAEGAGGAVPRHGQPEEQRPGGQPPGWQRPEGQADPRPLAGYAVLLGAYTALVATSTWLLRRRGARVDPVGPLELGMLALATAHVSRLLTKDSVTGVIRAPFTTFEQPAGEGESTERVVRHGVPHAVGELITCPFCTGQWVATVLVLGRAALPRVTAGVVTVAATARLADFAQLLYGAARRLT